MRTHQSRCALELIHVARVAVIAAAIICGLMTEPTCAGPTGERIVRGNVIFERDGNRTIIRASDGSIINYASFDILPWETVRFIQPDQLSRVLNRITGGVPTLIEGRLLANGQVYLVNPAGVAFGANSVVNVGTLYAAAGALTDANFIAGKDRFTNLDGDVVNRGLIEGDAVHLIGDHVANHGAIRAERGIVTMLAGDTAYIRQHGERITVKVDGRTITDRGRPYGGDTAPNITETPGVLNTGTIEARRGQVVLGAGDLYGFAIHNEGTIRAERGDITLAATDGAIHNEGLLDVSTDRGTAGDVVVQAPSIVNSGEIRADAERGRAGSVEVTSQDHTFLRPDSVISAAGGREKARGGEVLVHSYDGHTVFADGAVVDVSGGARGGHGGFAELSGKVITYNGSTRLEAKDGWRNGTLLIDPVNLVVNETGGDDAFILDDNMFEFGEGDMDSFIAADTFLSLVGDIRLQATGSIAVLAPIVLDPANGNVNLFFEAYRHINLSAPIIGAENLILAADFDGNGFGSVTIRDPLEISGYLEVSGTDLFLLGHSIVSGGTQIYDADVWLGSDYELTAPQLTFNGRVNSKPIFPNRSLTINGDVTFNGAVGDNGPPPIGFPQGDGALRFLRVNGDAIVNGGLVRTNEWQRYHGDVALGADAHFMSEQAGLVRFYRRLDGDHNALVSTAGQTRFDGAVGGLVPLRSLTTDAAGDTRLHGSSINAIDVLFGDPVTLHTDVTVDASSSIVFGGTIDGNRHDLQLNSPKTVFRGDVTEMGELHTDAAGDTAIDTGLIAGRVIDFGDAVLLGADTVVFGLELVNFESTIDNHYTLVALSDQFVRFAGDIGEFRPLKNLIVEAGGLGMPGDSRRANFILFDGTRFVTVDGEIAFNPDGKATPGFVATVGSTGDITIESLHGSLTFGPNEKMTSLGLLELIAEDGAVVIGDLNSVGDMLVRADEIVIRLREGAGVLTYENLVLLDSGVDLISHGDIRLEFNTIGVTGEGRLPVFASQEGILFPGPEGYVFLSQEFLPGQFTLLGLILDLTALIPGGDSVANLATAFETKGRIRDRLYLDPMQLRALDRFALYLRSFTDTELRAATEGRQLYLDYPAGGLERDAPLTSNAQRLRGESVLQVLDRYAGIFLAETTVPETGEILTDDQTDEIRAALTAAWDDFATSDAGDFRAFVEESPEHVDALIYLDALSSLFGEVQVMGVTPREYRASVDAILGPITPLSMEQRQLEAAIFRG